MKEGFIIENALILENDNCILVDNYFEENEIYNIPTNHDNLKSLKDIYSIGVWKIKSLKN